MMSAHIDEIVAHFAGYLRLFHDTARDRLHYDESAAPGPTGDYKAVLPKYDHPFMPDDLETEPGLAPPPLPEDLIQFVRGRPLKLLAGADDESDPESPLPGPGAPIPRPPGGGAGGGGSPDYHVRVTYQDGGPETQLAVHQSNFMLDEDVNLSAEALTALQPLITQLNGDAMAAIEQLVTEANARIPEDWQMPKTDGGVAEFVAARDEAWAERGGEADANSVTPGYYVNGEWQERPSESLPPHETKDLPDTGHGIGQWAAMGDNLSINAALIVDIGEAARTMAVMGDYFKTDAVFQTNTIVNDDSIRVSGGDRAPSGHDHDVVTNIADFIQHPSIYAGFPAHFAGPNWTVDVVNGDFYSVHAVAQVNYLSDNDVATQVSDSSHYNLVGGYNTLGNLAEIIDGGIEYDLIIIKGSYHGLNVIFQNNILLDNDRIKMAADDSDPSQSVTAGGNDLLNSATLSNYGGEAFDGLPEHLALIESLLAAGMTSLDPELAGALIGHGGPLKILYITGDYYDVNAIWQTNVTTDVDVMYQLQNQPLADLMALHPDETVTQSITTGGNELVNDAAIVDVNPDATYVGGDIYTDSILVQAELVPKSSDDAVNADTHTLVTELIAFVDDHSQDAAGAPPPAIASPVHADPMASVLH